ncbi:MAG: lamin tail domain-containing protein [Verrucomicrobiales bacterium]|nr:lamin tail domain-containing protein [Verrucomicrobiales bacterium]
MSSIFQNVIELVIRIIPKTFISMVFLIGLSGVPVMAETIVNIGEIRPFFGPDDLNLDPDKVVVAIDAYGDSDREVNGVMFLTDKSAPPNVTVTTTHSINDWAVRPDYTGADRQSVENLEEIMRDIRWSAAPSAVEISVSELNPGIEYELQMLFNEGAVRDRRWDIAIEGDLAVDDFSSEGEGTWTPRNGFAYIAPFVLAEGDDVLNVEMVKHFGGQSSRGSDNNPILQAFTITEITIPATPESILISSSEFFAEQNLPIGTLSTIDLKRNSNHLYSLVPGQGDKDNEKFEIEDSNVVRSRTYNFGAHDRFTEFSVRVRSTDADEPSRFIDYIMTLTLAEPLAPTSISLAANLVSSGIIVQGLVGKMSVNDPNMIDSHFYSLVEGVGDDDNSIFSIEADDLRLARTIPDGKIDLSIRLRVTDLTGLYLEKNFSLKVTDPSIRINEFMASNGNSLDDDDGDASDWVEIFNEQSGTLNLEGWYLTDDPDQLTKWAFPDINIAPNGFLVLFASGKERGPTKRPLHLNFEIASSGESLILVKPDGKTIIDQIDFPEQGVDVSYGYNAEANAVGFLQESSPGARNGDIADQVANDVTFSHQRGYYDSAFELELSSTIPDSVIRFTTNGSKPNNSSTIYAGPIRISPSTSSGTRGVRTVRAFSTHPSAAVSPVSTHTYIWVNGTGSPNSNGVVGQSRFISSIKNDQKYGPLIDDGLLSLPAISIIKPSGMGSSEGEGSLELISLDGSEPGFGIDCGMKIVGGASVGSPKNNFRCYFRNKYGASKLRYPVFANHPYTEKTSEVFDVLQLRGGSHDNFYWMANPGNPPGRKRQGDAQYVRNRWVNDMEMLMGHPSIHGRYVHCYLNGSYHGLYHIHERPMHNYMDKYFGGDPEDYHYTNSARTGSDHGGGDNWSSTWSKVKSAASAGGEESREWINWGHLADNQLLYYYCGNDWDWTTNHNWMAAGPKYPGRGGWRFYSWDCDVMLHDVDANNLGVSAPDGVFSSLMRDKDFKVFFSDRVYKHCFNGGVLSPNGPRAAHDYRMNEIYDALVSETARWQPSSARSLPWDRDGEWRDEWDYMQNVYWPRRTEILLSQFRSKGWYPLEAPEFDQRGGSVWSGYSPIILANEGDVYVTTDGSDPRLPGGAISPNAIFINGATVTDELIPKESVWKYLDDGSNQGTVWQLLEFDDSSWEEGRAELGYGDGANGAEGTILSYGSVGSDKHVTTYFRRNFQVDQVSEIMSINLGLRRDDGAVVYLNGKEIWRSAMPAGEIIFDTLANDGAGGSEESIFHLKEGASPELLLEGENTIAVEVHQVARTSSDISFDLEFFATRPSDPSQFRIEKSTMIRARALSGVDWSPLNEVTYTIGEPAGPTNLVISELHYRPLAPSIDEDPEGIYSRTDFEFIEIKNISDSPIHLSGLRFTRGISFDFSNSSILGLDPGGSAVLVEDQAAFMVRYPDVDPSNIIGKFKGNLNNDGELIELRDSTDSLVRSFTYNDKLPWPEGADGTGYSLVLIDPKKNPDHALAENWTTSRSLNGAPIGNDTAYTFSEWQVLIFNDEQITDENVSGPDADPDLDGLNNFAEYALGFSPIDQSDYSRFSDLNLVEIEGVQYYAFSYSRWKGVKGVSFTVQVSNDLEDWKSGEEYLVPLVGDFESADGSVNKAFRSAMPLNNRKEQFFRLKMIAD